MKGHLRLIRRLFFVLCALVVLNAGAFSACADDEELLEKSGEIIAHNAISDTEDQEEILTIVASGEKEEKKEEELLPVAVSEEGKEEKKEESLPDEPGEDIDSEEGNLLESTDPTDESMPLEEKNQTEEKDAIPTEDDVIKNEQAKEDDKPAENGQEDDQTDRQEEITVIESKKKSEDPAPSMILLSAPKRGGITEDNQEKTEEPVSEEPALRNTKGSTEYTVAISIEGNPTIPSGNYFIFAYVDSVEYKQPITGSKEYALILPSKPERIFIAYSDGCIIYELQANNKRYYIIPTPEFDEENRKYTFNIKERLDCRMYFSKLASDLQISGNYYVVVKRKGSGTPIACASINNGIPVGFDSVNIYNDSTFVIYKTDSFNFDYYKSNSNSYSPYILKPGEETDNGVVFSWSSEPELVNGSYVYYICADKKKEPETEERREHGTVTIYNTDQDGTELSGSTFKLYADEDCETEISTYTGGSFTIYTGEESLTDYLPDGTENNNTETFYLKETAAPTGYQRDENTHPVVISASITRFTDEEQNKIVIKTSYGITIDSVAAISITNQIQTKAITENASVTVTNRDQDGAELSGSTFKLYAEAGCTTEIGSYTDESFMINTGDESLTNYLPDGTENNNTKTFYLKEMVAPNGYKGDENTHRVVITATITRYPDEKEDKIVVKTSYVITIDGVETIDIENTKLTGTERVDRIITIVNKDDSGNELNGSSFGLYSNDSCTAAIVTCTGGRFTIGTDETALANYLPTETGAGNARKLYLKQTAAPAGYDADIIVHIVVITKVIDTYLDNEANKFITRTTYEITIDDGSTIDITNSRRTKEECVHGNATVTNKDETGEALSGLTFGLYPLQECAEGTEIATYSAQCFIISTNLDALESHLPTGTSAENATTLYLKQMAAPAGYNADTAKHRVAITKAESTDFVVASNTYVTTTTYGITIDGESRIEITNTKRTDKERVDGSITVTAKDQDGAALAGLTFGLYPEQACAEGTEIATYSAQSFIISTNLDTLESHLPTGTGAGNATTLYLKQKAAPIGYNADPAVYPVVITKTVKTELVEVSNMYTYVTTTTYGIAIDARNAIDVTNTKRTKEEWVHGNATVTTKDAAGEALSGLTFGLYPSQECVKGTEITTYTGQNFEIRTDLDALKSCLPIKTGVDNASKLYLKETEAPTNYDIDMTIHTVSISKKETMYLDAAKDTYVAKVTYGITIDNQNSIVITNKIHIDSNGEEGNTTITGTEGIATGGNDGDPVITEENGNTTTDGKENNVTIEEVGGTTATGNNGNGMTGGENGKTTTGSTGETSATGMKRDAGAKHSAPRLGAEKINTNKNNETSGIQADDTTDSEKQMNWITSVLQKTVEILTTVLELLSNILHIGFLTF